MTTIKDPVHDHIEVDGVARDLLDTPAVQRLRRIAQLGTVSLVYPSANHTRFEHSLGVYALACQALESLGVEGPAAEHVEAAAVLHDVGHGPFSHNLEALIARETGRYHDDIGDLLGRGIVGDVLADHGLSPERVAAIVAGEGEYAGVVSGELDVDRMDYLVRDAHHTGVPYGTIDHGRLVRELDVRDGELVLSAGNVQTAESLLVARALMNPVVYNHHVARISKALLRRAGERLLETGAVTAPRLRRMDDADFLAAVRSADATAEYARRVDDRDLFKRAVWAEIDAVPEPIRAADHETRRRLEADVAEAASVDRADVVVDVQAEPAMAETSSRVVVAGEVRRLDEQSPLVDALRATQRSQWRLGVYAPAELTDTVGHAAVEVLGLDVDGSLVAEARGATQPPLSSFSGPTDDG